MSNEWLKSREALLFKTEPECFAQKWDDLRKSYTIEFAGASEERKQEIAWILGELSIDIGSYLKKWNLQSSMQKAPLNDEEINNQIEINCNILRKWNYDDIADYVIKEIDSISKSNMMKLSLLADENIINNRWGNDYASGLAESMRKGAILATTNPPLINNARKEDPLKWNKVKSDIKLKYPDYNSEALASVMTMKVVLENCKTIRPVFEITKGEYGYISLQINPKNSIDTELMIKEAEFIYDQLKEELNGIPNVVFKLPGTKASIEAARYLTYKGIGVTITLSFSVDQHQAFAEVIECGNAKVSFLVMMSGRLDDPIKEELQCLGLENAAEIAKYASSAVIKKSYYDLYVKKKHKRSAILVASLRGPWNIEAAITDKDSPIYITSFPDKTEEYDNIPREIVSHIDRNVDQEILKILSESKIFRQAYGIENMTPEDFDSFYPVSITLDSFSKAYDEFVKYIEED